MPNHPGRGNPALTPMEISAIREAVEFRLAGEVEGSAAQVAALDSASRKLGAAPARTMWLPYSGKELELLWLAVGNGAGDDAINYLGLTAAEKRILGAAANRLAAAGKLGGPRFSE